MAIPYPVPEGTKCRAYDPVGQVFVSGTKPWPRKDRMEVTPSDGTVLLVLTEADKPAYDPATHKLVDSFVVDGNEYRHEWTVTALTQDELDARAEAAQDETDRGTLRALYDDFKAGTATNRQAQAAIAWLLKQYASE